MTKNIGIKIEDNGKAKVVSIEGLLDAPMASAVHERLYDVLEGDTSTLIFNLENLEYISSAGLRVLLYSAQKMQAKKGKTALCKLPKNVQRVLDISGLNTVFTIYPDVSEAIAAMA
ncbi:MAG: STAS domain-containing protein [Bdellovibrionaceae bacterium]|nr:STAS domain-containing protein [Pseudobdellovibrionaceae bacterium]